MLLVYFIVDIKGCASNQLNSVLMQFHLSLGISSQIRQIPTWTGCVIRPHTQKPCTQLCKVENRTQTMVNVIRFIIFN